MDFKEFQEIMIKHLGIDWGNKRITHYQEGLIKNSTIVADNFRLVLWKDQLIKTCNIQNQQQLDSIENKHSYRLIIQQRGHLWLSPLYLDEISIKSTKELSELEQILLNGDVKYGFLGCKFVKSLGECHIYHRIEKTYEI